jgi:hypothetical protein
VVARKRFLGTLGLALSAFSALVIISMWMADAFLGMCDGS